MPANKLFSQPIEQIGRALREGAVSAVALAETAAANRAGAGADLAAYKHWNGEAALAEAETADRLLRSGRDLGLLQGIPVSIKDLYGVPGYPIYAGTPLCLPESWERPGPVIRRLLRQMAVVMGKTHTVEFAFGGIGTNPHWGTPRNPWDAENHRVPGGSSCGAGVSLAEGSALVALGTDTAGSVRIPACWTGNVGFKSSFGRWPLDGIVPLSSSLDTAGALTRTVEDAATAFCALDAHARRQRIPRYEAADLRIGIGEDFFWSDCSPGVAEVTKGALDELAAKGARTASLDLPGLGTVNEIFRAGGLAAVELFTSLKADLPEWLDAIDPNVRQRMNEAETLPAHEYVRRSRVLAGLAKTVSDVLRSVDVLAMPTVPLTPPTVAELKVEGVYPPANLLSLRNTSVVNYLDLCAITLPVGLDKAGMPVGLQLVGRGGDDEKVLGVALAVEAALGTGVQRLGRPPLARSEAR